MAERKAVNKYYPPDWDPSKGSVNKHVGQHPLRERARKLSQGILVIRFEMPYNIWCGGCGNHIGMGVRYNAEKKKVGNYYTTPIYRFRMKCHLCDNYIEIETDPKNCDYTIISGARRKEERWDPGATENVQATDHAEKQKLIDDAMYKLEHGERDKRKSKAAIPGLVQIKEIQSPWKDDFALNQILRKKFRQEKKLIIEKDAKDQEIKDKGSLDIELVNEDPEDIQLAKKIRFHSTGFEEDQRKRRFQIKARPMFADNASSVTDNRRAKLLQKRQKMLITKPDHGVTLSAFSSDSDSLGIRRRENKVKACIDINVKHGNKKDLAREKDDIAQDYGEDNDRNQTTLNPVQNEKTSSNMFSNTDTSYEKESRLRTALQTFKHEVRKPSTTSTVDRDNDVDKKKCLTAEQDRNREMLRPKISLISENYSDTDSDCSM